MNKFTASLFKEFFEKETDSPEQSSNKIKIFQITCRKCIQLLQIKDHVNIYN